MELILLMIPVIAFDHHFPS